jgi:uncharacterized membrane protein YhaH (DUF805 family)
MDEPNNTVMFALAILLLFVVPFSATLLLVRAVIRNKLSVAAAATINALVCVASPFASYAGEKSIERSFGWSIDAVARTPIYIFIVFGGGLFAFTWLLSFWSVLARCAPRWHASPHR